MVYRTPQEKMLIVHTHKYFLAEAQQRLDHLGRAVRERVAKALAVSESMVARVLAAYNVHGEEAFAVPTAKCGCPPRSEVENYREFITEIINDRNISRKPTTSKIICSELKTLKGETIPCERNLCESMFPTSEVVSATRGPAPSYCNVNHVAGGAYVEQQPPSEIAPAPTMEELQDLAGEVSDKVHCSNIMGEMDTSAQFEEFEIAL
ncbi:hypothetical protein PC113_g1651 [Phytophthora cactorum]|uniref:Uncharacterized protein n=2 Tax=Phytophthora cactorum TaxID=29920 RepID=A0A8T0ZWI0_9STRA|nr:hypothetical protein PC113_g1651 [Phytophthora cactorum]KAG3193299.1 hypothetical protein C6341_g226 [Phytophthora cactorum]